MSSYEIIPTPQSPKERIKDFLSNPLKRSCAMAVAAGIATYAALSATAKEETAHYNALGMSIEPTIFLCSVSGAVIGSIVGCITTPTKPDSLLPATSPQNRHE